MLSAPETAALVGWYVENLTGRRAKVLKSQTTTWAWLDRADAIQIVNRALDDALETWAHSETSPNAYKGRTSEQVASALRRRWGVEAYPDRSALEIDGSKTSHSTLRNWENSAIASTDFRVELERSYLSRLGHTSPDDRVWVYHLPSAFPPESPSRESMLDIARKAGLGADQAANIQAVRQVITMRVRRYLSAEPRHLIHHREVVESAWFRADVQFVEPVRGMLHATDSPSSIAETGAMVRVSRAVTRLQFFLCLDDPKAFARELQATARARASFKMFLQHAEPKLVLVARPKLASTAQLDFDRQIDPDTPAARAISLADEIRAAPKSQRSPLVREYVELRHEIQDHLASYSDAYARVIVQADQSVSHDSMDAMDEEGFYAVDRLRVAATRTGPLNSYGAMTWRDRGVLASKKTDLSAATRITDRGIEELLAIDPSDRGDGHAFLESLHQHFLSNAGTAVKIVETLMRDVPRKLSMRRSVRVYEQWSQTAIDHASRAFSALGQLDGPNARLPTARHADGFIASRDWWIQTRIMYLRALLGAHTLLSAVDSEAAEDGGTGLGIMRALYSEIGSDPRLRRPRTNTFTQLAIWLAFVDGMSVPYVENPSQGLSDVPFLTLSHNEGRAGLDRVQIDEERLMRAHFWFDNATGWDRGPLAQVERRSQTAHFLRTKTDGLFDLWLEGQA